MRATLFWFVKNVEFKFVAGHFQKKFFLSLIYTDF